MEDRSVGFRQAASVLPMELRAEALALPGAEQETAEELRLRVGRPVSVVFPEGERWLNGPDVTGAHLERLLELASRSSVHAVLDQIREGFLTVQGGHRVGLCGTAVLQNGQISALRCLSSASIRIARSFPNSSAPMLARLSDQGRLESTLILAPPGAGKTTLLRDLIRAVSDGEGVEPMRVGVVDQRGELGAVFQGVPQMDLGSRTDILDGCPKAEGLMLLLRGMNPQVLAVDEITDPADIRALILAAGCGVTILATAHGTGREDLSRRPLYRELLSAGIFRRLVTISGRGGARRYEVEGLT